jgi:monoamine oxidase
LHASIIGAGLAGLAAAEALSSAGISVDVIEARSRIGGRVWSERLANGAVVEKGGEFILEGYDLTRALASRLGISLAPTGMAYGDREPRGGPPVSRTELFEVSRTLARVAEEGGATRASLGELLDELAMSPGARAAIESRLSISTGHDARELASHLAGHTSSTFSPTESARVAGGNLHLAEALAQALSAPVRTKHVAAEVRWDQTSVTVAGSGFSIESDVAVITIPATVLDDLSFQPALPAPKNAAHASVDFGHAAKLFVPLRHPVSPSAVMSVPDRFWCWTACDLHGEVQPVVSCFAGSAAALERLRVDRGPGVWLDRLRLLRPDLELVHDEAICSTWDDDPWVHGAYSVELAGRPRDHAGLQQPVGPLFFAGEHTAGPWAGTIEGALRSGVRAADQIIALTDVETP